MAPMTKPETVLKQAEGLVSVGQTHAALQSLTDMFSSKRFRSTPLASLEPIMIRFVELCIDMRKGRIAKEGLMQYKNIAQNTSVASIEVVVQKFIQLADAKVQDAQAQAEKVTADALADVDDLEATETPESILLGAVSGDQSKDRTDRALVTPWLKFLWESYRTALETLKNNARLEAIYQNIAQQAFAFCLKHKRKIEFRRLCETLRLHLANVAKYAHQPHAINLQDADTLQRHLDTRFAQLNAAVELELWQEAFRTVEDVHNLLTMAKKAPRPSMMANYYEKLTKIFLMSGNALYHAAAWAKYYSVVTSIGGRSDEEMSRLAGQVLISALAVPVSQNEHAADESRTRTTRLTALLGLPKPPTRTSLLRDALSRNVLRLAPDLIRSLYDLLQVTFDPLTLCSSVAPKLVLLAEDAAYAPYLPLLQRALLSRFLVQLAQVYSSLKIEHLLDILAPLRDAAEKGAGSAHLYSAEQVEQFIMAAAHAGDLAVRIDHAEGELAFMDEPFLNLEDGSGGTVREDAVQPSASSIVRSRLSTIATTLHNTLQILTPPVLPSPAEQQERLATLVAAAEAERKALSLRRAIVAKRRELVTELSAKKEKEEAMRRAERTRVEAEEERKKQIEAARKRDIERARAQIQSQREEEARQLAKSLKERGTLKADIDTLTDLNTDSLMQLQVQQLEKDKKEREERLRVASKRIDHIERAYRKEERPLLAQDYELQQANDRAAFEEAQRVRIEEARTAHERDLDTKKRLRRMLPEFERRRDEILGKRREEYERKRAKAAAKIEEEKAKRRAKILAERAEEDARRAEEERIRREQAEEEERLRAEREEEEARVAAEEEERAAREEAEKRAAEEKLEAERRARQAQREADFEAARRRVQEEEEREARRAAAKRAPPPAVAPRPVAAAPEPIAAGGGGWRSRAAAAAAAGSGTPPRAESPAPAKAAYRPPGAAAGGAPAGGGWRARAAAAREAGGSGSGSASPAPAPASPALAPTRSLPQREERRDDDGFKTVGSGGGKWGASRLRRG
ncbi:unnamed protein product [Peniophora sp. CBMAI 1063]|nr:unnamed protein product [Peniophora sp. CBMAI 1063]